MKTDITSREDLEKLVSGFYEKATRDYEIGHFFEGLNLPEHIPQIVDFWESIILGNPVYQGNPMRAHVLLNQRHTMAKEHFSKWLMLWEETASELFEGKNTNEVIQRAQNIASLMSLKVGAA